MVLAATACESTPERVGPGAPGVQVQVFPPAAQLPPGGTETFRASVTGAANTSVTWSVAEAAGGVVTAGGRYAAPGSPGLFHVVATSVADGTASATATVTVTQAPMPVAVVVAPVAPSVDACGTVRFEATVSGAADAGVTWSVVEGAAGGMVSAAGLYTAPAADGVYHVTATSAADGTKSATAAVTVATRVLSVAVAPASATVTMGSGAQFSAEVTTTCGTFPAD
jgi:hypothetical protein